MRARSSSICSSCWVPTTRVRPIGARSSPPSCSEVPYIERRGDHWRVIGGPVPPGSASITLRPLVSVRERWAGDEQLALHEAAHLRQGGLLRVVRFPRRDGRSHLGPRLIGCPPTAAWPPDPPPM